MCNLLMIYLTLRNALALSESILTNSNSSPFPWINHLSSLSRGGTLMGSSSKLNSGSLSCFSFWCTKHYCIVRFQVIYWRLIEYTNNVHTVKFYIYYLYVQKVCILIYFTFRILLVDNSRLPFVFPFFYNGILVIFMILQLITMCFKNLQRSEYKSSGNYL